MYTLIALCDRNGFFDQMTWLEKSYETIEDAVSQAEDSFKYLCKHHNADIQIWIIDDIQGDVLYHFHEELNIDPLGLGYPTCPHYLYLNS